MTQQSPLLYIVDDDPIFNKTVTAVMKRLGVVCQAFEESTAFLNAFKSVLPTVCIIDLNLGQKASGFDLIRVLRDSYPATIPILVVSVTDDRTAITQALHEGADDFILKPLTREIFTAKLTPYLATPEFVNLAADLESIGNADLKATIKVGVEVQEIDEIGIRILSPHLVSKGTVLSLGGPEISAVTGRPKPALLTTTSTWLQNESGVYGAFLEFNISDAELVRNVRAWIAQKR